MRNKAGPDMIFASKPPFYSMGDASYQMLH